MAGKQSYLEQQLEYQNSKVEYLVERGAPVEKLQYHLDKIDYINERLEQIRVAEEYLQVRAEAVAGV